VRVSPVTAKSSAAIGELGDGDVLVVRCTDPCWLPAFGRVAGLVTEVGGWLSHAAIQAREHNLPAIVGAPNATALLQTGDVVRLRRDGIIERVLDTPAAVTPKAPSKSASVA
jgi:phosphohistidine swiveling domain-containing protein